ncbi:expressed unknown protein [Seminavis robusta]|uniref:Uncharacterized protein n=1 Tax=Seminavis robusta TaxID=568900 RepID=A0A9N8HGR9_9STRA|nr:expressed unknown protein [Seminavis robusta]|eukprot:Sro655_g182180.1 n/a (184) ;mRNA; r:1890-2441
MTNNLLQLLLLLCLGLTVQPVHGYANWLKCYVDLDDTEVVMNKKIKTHDDADHIVELQVQKEGDDESWTTSTVSYPANKATTYKIKVKPPQALQGSNMQFVVEYEATFNNGESTTTAAQFTFPKMCDGKRSFARNCNEPVTFEINGTADSVEIWGAWAIGFGQVSLTPRLVFLKGDPEPEAEL